MGTCCPGYIGDWNFNGCCNILGGGGGGPPPAPPGCCYVWANYQCFSPGNPAPTYSSAYLFTLCGSQLASVQPLQSFPNYTWTGYTSYNITGGTVFLGLANQYQPNGCAGPYDSILAWLSANNPPCSGGAVPPPLPGPGPLPVPMPGPGGVLPCPPGLIPRPDGLGGCCSQPWYWYGNQWLCPDATRAGPANPLGVPTSPTFAFDNQLAFSAAGIPYASAANGIPSILAPGSDGQVIQWSSGVPTNASPSAGSYTQQTTNVTTGSNSGAAETDLQTYTLAAGALGTDGDSLHIEYVGEWDLLNAGATQTVKAYFGGTAYQTISASPTTPSPFSLRVTIHRDSSTSVRYSAVAIYSTGAAGSPPIRLAEGQITGLTLSNTQVIKITGQATNSNDISCFVGKIAKVSAA